MDVDMDTHNDKYAHNGKVLLCSATFLFFMFILVIFLHSHSYSCLRRRRHNRHLFPTATADTHTALEPSLFKFLPTFTYSSATGLHLQECAVCLSEFEEGEDGCILPNCNHFFHTHCIDTWFRTHSNCPICRALVQPPQVSPQKTEAGIPGGEYAGCSHLPPPMPCPRKELDLDMLSVIVKARKEETGENTRSSESGSPGDTGLKTPDDGVWKGILEGAGSGKAVNMWV